MTNNKNKIMVKITVSSLSVIVGPLLPDIILSVWKVSAKNFMINSQLNRKQSKSACFLALDRCNTSEWERRPTVIVLLRKLRSFVQRVESAVIKLQKWGDNITFFAILKHYIALHILFTNIGQLVRFQNGSC